MPKSRFRIIALRPITPNGCDEETLARVRSIQKKVYNYHKCEALRMLDLKERYTDARIVEFARMILQSPSAKVTAHGMKYITQLKHDIFAVEFGRKHHRCFS